MAAMILFGKVNETAEERRARHDEGKHLTWPPSSSSFEAISLFFGLFPPDEGI